MSDKTYKVTVKEVHSQVYYVNAKNKEEAIKKVSEGGGEIDEGSFWYDHMLSSDKWTIEEDSLEIMI